MADARSLSSIFIVIIVLITGLWLGVSIVTEQTQTVLYISGSALLLTCVILGRRIWLLLILFTALNVPLIRGFGTTELGQALFISFTILATLMRRQPYRFTFGEKEVWMLLLAACILQVYFRNPVGLNMFGADAVGARPYFMAGMTFLSSLILGNIVTRPSEIRLALWLSIIGSIASGPLNALRTGIGGGGAVAIGQGNSTISDGSGAGRIMSLAILSSIAARVTVSFTSPLRALRHPLWALLILFSLAAAAMSGYRNAVALVGLIFLVGLAYRSGGMAVFVSSVACAVGLALLAFVNLASPLPANIQRALSPFPGTWEQRHVDDATQSSEWRIEMWEEALFTNYWIENKILGDGLGFTSRELRMMKDLEDGGTYLGGQSSGLLPQQEMMMLQGSYHSGPVQTVRTVGYVGLAILLVAMIRLAVHAHRQILRCRGTEWYSLALFTCIPVIVLPPYFILIFGEFGKDVSAVFFSYAMISLLEKNLPLPPYIKPRHAPYILSRSPRTTLTT